METPAGRGEKAILDPSASARRIEVGRSAPGPALAPWVDYFWWVHWDVEEPEVQEVIPAPVVHLTAERGTGGAGADDGRARLMVTGVQRARFVRPLEGRGHVVAACFRPGGFRAFLGSSVLALRDRRVPAASVLGVGDDPVAARVLGHDVARGVALLGTWLLSLEPEQDPVGEDLAALVERAEQDTDLTRAEQLAALAGVSLRTLQRQFGEYVGVSPKWVVQRFRLLDVAAAAHAAGADRPVDWAALAVELGFSDQSHLIRAFTQVVGRPPASYAREA